MQILNHLKQWLFAKLFWGVLRHLVTDEQYAKIRYRLEQNQSLNLINPSRFTEKIQWIKLYDRTELRKEVADRLRVRRYVSDRIGDKHLVPLHEVCDKLTQKVWASLPDQFVLKANHGCEMVKIVRDKTNADYSEFKQITGNWMATNYFNIGREWVYKDLKRTILAEKLLLDENMQIPSDYKFFCFHGEVMIIQIDFDRFGNQKRNLYDRDFNRIEGQLLYPNFEGNVTKPAGLDHAVDIAEALSKEFSFIRVDLYIVNSHVYFGELTNYPGNGFIEFRPESLEMHAGSLLTLPRE
jgi:hypothetical protein